MLPQKLYDLETAITHCFTTGDDLDLILEHVLEADALDRDTLANALLGLKELHELRCQKAVDLHAALIKDLASTSRPVQ